MKKFGFILLSLVILVSGCSSKENNESEKIETSIEDSKFSSFDEPKTYSDEVMYNDTMTVNADGVVIENATFNNDLIISSEVGDGDVILRNIIVNGELIINGGGENSIEVIGSDINKIIVEREEAPVRLYLDADSVAQTIEVKNQAKIDVDGLVDRELNVNSQSDIMIGENAKIQSLNLHSEVFVDLIGSVMDFNVFESANNSIINMQENSSIGTLKVEPKISISGTGMIDELLSREDILNKELLINNKKIIMDLLIESGYRESEETPGPTPTIATTSVPVVNTTSIPSVVVPTPIPVPLPTPETVPTPVVTPDSTPEIVPTPVVTPEPTQTPSGNYADTLNVNVEYKLIPFETDVLSIKLDNSDKWDLVEEVWTYPAGKVDEIEQMLFAPDYFDTAVNGELILYGLDNPDGEYVLRLKYIDGSYKDYNFELINTSISNDYSMKVNEIGDINISINDASNIDLDNLILKLPGVLTIYGISEEVKINNSEMIKDGNTLTITNEILNSKDLYNYIYYGASLYTTEGVKIESNGFTTLALHSVKNFPNELSNVSLNNATNILKFTLKSSISSIYYKLEDDTTVLWNSQGHNSYDFISSEITEQEYTANYSVDLNYIISDGVNLEHGKTYTLEGYNYGNDTNPSIEVEFIYEEASQANTYLKVVEVEMIPYDYLLMHVTLDTKEQWNDVKALRYYKENEYDYHIEMNITEEIVNNINSSVYTSQPLDIMNGDWIMELELKDGTKEYLTFNADSNLAARSDYTGEYIDDSLQLTFADVGSYNLNDLTFVLTPVALPLDTPKVEFKSSDFTVVDNKIVISRDTLLTKEVYNNEYTSFRLYDKDGNYLYSTTYSPIVITGLRDK